VWIGDVRGAGRRRPRVASILSSCSTTAAGIRGARPSALDDSHDAAARRVSTLSRVQLHPLNSDPFRWHRSAACAS